MYMSQGLHLFDAPKCDNPSLLHDLCKRCHQSNEVCKQRMA